MKFLVKLFILFVAVSAINGIGEGFSKPLEEFNLEETVEEIEEVEPAQEIVEDEVKEVVKEESNNNISSASEKKETREVKTNNQEKIENKEESISAWEEIGLTEDEYYNKPIMSWQKVTHSTMDECKKEGQKTIEDENSDYETFWCYEVYSPSGNFLGAMLSLS